MCEIHVIKLLSVICRVPKSAKIRRIIANIGQKGLQIYSKKNYLNFSFFPSQQVKSALHNRNVLMCLIGLNNRHPTQRTGIINTVILTFYQKTEFLGGNATKWAHNPFLIRLEFGSYDFCGDIWGYRTLNLSIFHANIGFL